MYRRFCQNRHFSALVFVFCLVCAHLKKCPLRVFLEWFESGSYQETGSQPELKNSAAAS